MGPTKLAGAATLVTLGLGGFLAMSPRRDSPSEARIRPNAVSLGNASVAAEVTSVARPIVPTAVPAPAVRSFVVPSELPVDPERISPRIRLSDLQQGVT